MQKLQLCQKFPVHHSLDVDLNAAISRHPAPVMALLMHLQCWWNLSDMIHLLSFALLWWNFFVALSFCLDWLVFFRLRISSFYQFVSPQDHLESTLWNWQSKQSDSNSVFCILFDGPVHGKTVCTVFMTGKPIVGPPKTSSDRLHLACFQFPIQFHVGLYLSDFQFPIQIFMYRPALGWFSILSGPPLVWSGRE